MGLSAVSRVPFPESTAAARTRCRFIGFKEEEEEEEEGESSLIGCNLKLKETGNVEEKEKDWKNVVCVGGTEPPEALNAIGIRELSSELLSYPLLFSIQSVTLYSVFFGCPLLCLHALSTARVSFLGL